MVKYIIKRLLLAAFILLLVSIFLYFLVRLMPANAIETKYFQTHANSDENKELLKAMLARYNLDDPSFGGIIKGWWQWITSFFAGDMGTSFQQNRKVEDIIVQNMGISFSISLISLILEVLIAIPLGIKCACNQYGKLDYTATVITMIGISFPTFFFGNIIIKFFAVDLGWFPANGINSNLLTTATGWERFTDMLWHMVLPLFVLTILSIGSLMRYTRTNTLEVLNADYIRTARAKGLSEGKVVYKHVFRNTMIPLVTVLASTLPGLFGGAMITETIFGIPGIGKIAYDLMYNGDIPFIMAYNMFIAVLTVIGILLADVMYAVVDPRVKLGK
ncbi:MAG: ABC transporter permease [Clostridiales bacterium]|nr:ABC transporter permease [Clostridiales bacterium]